VDAPEDHLRSGVDPVDVDPPASAVVDAVTRALAEDLLPLGDLTAALVPPTATAAVAIVSREAGVVAGRACAVEAFRQIDPTLEVAWLVPDGGRVDPGDRVAEISGTLRSILTAERTVLNFLGHLSGVASLTRRYVDAVVAANPATRVLDTRKTTPGLRALEKAAVRAGGGHNHRGSLSDAVLVKDNHLAGLSIAEGVARAKDLWPGRMVEVECDQLSQVDEAVAAGATVIMLDNMSIERVAGCVSQLRADGVNTLVEVSGGVDLSAAPKLAIAGADLISVGALTHSAPVLDLGFDLAPSPAQEG
jgi:nicotinate-nucleotide pyrophosphorylase (carboxylating)